MQNYRAVIVGLGNIAWKFDLRKDSKEKTTLTHAQTFQNNPKVNLVGGCSPEKKDMELFQKKFSVHVSPDLTELITNTKPDIVSICSPCELHYKHILTCMENDIPMIWLEKPPTKNIEELKEIIEVKKRKKTTVIVNYQRRYCASYNRLKTFFIEKPLGNIIKVDVKYSKGLKINGSHFVDIVFFVLGERDSLSIEIISKQDKINPSFLVSFENNITAQFSGYELPYHNLDLSITCEKGRASIIHGGMTTVWEEKVEHKLFPGFYRLEKSKNNPLGKGDFDGCFENALNDLITSYEQKKDPVSSLETSYNTQLLIDKIESKLKLD